MQGPKDSLDLMNVDYDDVLHLYQGWRKAESALKDKDKELSQMKQRINTLQDSHGKFRNQIQALEAVKELTVSLQGQLSALQQENCQLVNENQELAALNMNAEAILHEKEADESQQSKMLRDVQLEFATLRGRYDESLKAHRELERIAADEQAMRISMETRLIQTDHHIEDLREENRSLRQELDSANHKLNQCDQELMHASEQLSSISREVVNISTTKDALVSTESEVGVLKGDISRLIRLLEQSSATREFIAHWKDSNGMHFVGIDRDGTDAGRGNIAHAGEVFAQSLRRSGMGLSEADLMFSNPDGQIPQSTLSKYDLSPVELNHLKEVHGNDPFPLTSSLAEEAEYWVPADAAKLGVQFMSHRFPGASPKVIMDFLRNMNKIWLRRERRKVKRVKEVMSVTIDDLKRQISYMKPYKGVIAERQIRRLKSQVKAGLSKTLKGRARGPLEQGPMDEQKFDLVDFDYPEAPHERRLCKLNEQAKHYADGDVTRVSTEKLLEASLTSLSTMSKRLSRAGADRLRADTEAEESEDDYRRDNGIGIAVSRSTDANGGSIYPSASYLRGALWLGRNMTLVSEELAEDLEKYRTKYLAEVSEISNDPDFRRACHRLTLLAGSGINHCVSAAGKTRNTTREILQGAASLEPGNANQLHRFLGSLPIESALTDGGRSGIHTIMDQRQQRSSSAPATAMSNKNKQSPSNRSIRFSILDSPLQADDLNRSHSRG